MAASSRLPTEWPLREPFDSNRQEKSSFIHDLQQGTTSNYCHFIASEIFYDNLIAYLQFFVGPEISPQYFYKVNIGKKPGEIIYKESKGHQFVYYDEPDKDGFIGRMDSLNIFSRELLPEK